MQILNLHHLFSVIKQMPGLTLILVILLALSACAPKSVHTQERAEPIITPEAPFGPPQSFEAFINTALNRQHSPVETLFTPMDNGEPEALYLIVRERPVLILDNNVTSFQGGPDYLATGYTDGSIRILGRQSCSGVVLPARENVRGVWWDGYGPYLAAAGEDKSKLTLFDLDRCAGIHEISAPGPVFLTALSRFGNHIAIVDEGRRLWVGKTGNELEHLATLRYDPLQMVFSPGSGVLVLVDAAGWLTLWTVDDYEILEQVLIPGGIFQQADFIGATLVLDNNLPSQTAWDIPSASKASFSELYGSFVLDDRLLYYMYPDFQYIKKTFMGKPEFTVVADQDTMTIKVVEIAGRETFYRAADGNLSQHQTLTDPEEISVDIYGGFTWAGAEYILADPVMITDQHALWARYVEGRGYYLWWTPNPGLDKMNFPQKLPQRDNIRKDIPPHWENIY
ncbi:WD40 repeat domain-containing protein [Desulfonatronovibrio magnus]|uniref:WD40 repeat domain-containing protein n=1 Tax=Desulfonatronovibrio magnus TaxID=698827 RepID=UPI0005EB1C56|nr:WD40 repeat domain-containing protein [Desulfonatronovibrio magnus]